MLALVRDAAQCSYATFICYHGAALQCIALERHDLGKEPHKLVY